MILDPDHLAPSLLDLQHVVAAQLLVRFDRLDQMEAMCLPHNETTWSLRHQTARAICLCSAPSWPAVRSREPLVGIQSPSGSEALRKEVLPCYLVASALVRFHQSSHLFSGGPGAGSNASRVIAVPFDQPRLFPRDRWASTFRARASTFARPSTPISYPFNDDAFFRLDEFLLSMAGSEPGFW